jgi:hypothetical protein
MWKRWGAEVGEAGSDLALEGGHLFFAASHFQQCLIVPCLVPAQPLPQVNFLIAQPDLACFQTGDLFLSRRDASLHLGQILGNCPVASGQVGQVGRYLVPFARQRFGPAFLDFQLRVELLQCGAVTVEDRFLAGLCLFGYGQCGLQAVHIGQEVVSRESF